MPDSTSRCPRRPATHVLSATSRSSWAAVASGRCASRPGSATAATCRRARSAWASCSATSGWSPRRGATRRPCTRRCSTCRSSDATATTCGPASSATARAHPRPPLQPDTTPAPRRSTPSASPVWPARASRPSSWRRSGWRDPTTCWPWRRSRPRSAGLRPATRVARMGKASRRPRGDRADRSARPLPAPFVARRFQGLPNETDWVAMREIVPAATATVRFAEGKAPEGAPDEVTIATVLPLAWPGLHREGGEVLVGIQSGNASGDTSRDIAQAIALASVAQPGSPVETLPVSTADTPRLQDILDTDAPFEMQLHEGFDFWVADADLDADGKESLERANESAIPTVRLDAAPSAFWCRIGDRTYVRWVLPFDEDTSTNALARLHAAGENHLGDDGRLLGCFRSSGLLIPVWEVDSSAAAADFEDGVAAMKAKIDTAAASTEALTAAERGARA